MLDSRVALITGANQGIGLQVARDLAKAGLTVLVGSRDLAKGEEAAKTIEGAAYPIQIDVTDLVSIATAAKRIQSQFGRLDVLINNAAIARADKVPGLAHDASLADYAKATAPSVVPLEELRAVWETNVFGPLQVYQAMYPLLKESPAARIVNVSSAVGSMTLNANPQFPYRGLNLVYAASKTALNAITLAVSIELESTGIKVNAASPGFTNTALNNFAGTDSVEDGASEIVRLALLGPDGPTGTFSHNTMGSIPW